MVLIDAAKGSATEPPDLSQYPADFVVMSFYKVHIFVWIVLETITFGYWFLVCMFLEKLFGYPTGLGVLIARKGK